MNNVTGKAKSVLFEAQNTVIRSLLKYEFSNRDFFEMEFLGNHYSGYWFPKILLSKRGTIWGVGLGFDSSFEFELLQKGYSFCGFEPERNCYDASLAQFHSTNAKIESYGLWDKSGYFKFTGENISIVNIFNLSEESEQELEIRSLWEVAKEKNFEKSPRPRVLKMNIEGAEREILQRFVNEPLDLDVVIFQAEFLFFISFKKIIGKMKAYLELRRILKGMRTNGFEIIDFSRHQITLMKTT